jgi:hypothetical protein
MQPFRALLKVSGLVALTIVGLGALDDAGAHSEDGVMELTAEPSGRRVEVQVVLTYANDGEPAEAATVTAFATNDRDEATGASDLPRTGRGTYAGAVTVTGAGVWTVQATADGPTAAASAVVTVDDTTTTTDATTTTRPAAGGNDADTAGSASTAESANDDDSSTVVVVAIAVIVTAVGVAAAVLVRRRNATRHTPDDAQH